MTKLPVPAHYSLRWSQCNQPKPLLSKHEHHVLTISIVGIIAMMILIHFA
jgi:hypothetical protein